MVDYCILIVLLFDLVLRYLSYQRKVDFLKSPFNVICMVGTLPSLVGYTFMFVVAYDYDNYMRVFSAVDQDDIKTYIFAICILSALGALRLLTMLKLMKYCECLRIIVLTLKYSLHEMFLLFYILLLCAVLFGHVIFTCELSTMTIQSVPRGIWWAVVTMTTLGYGDIIPETFPGRVFASVCVVLGIMLIALPVPIIAGNFVKFYGISRLLKKPKEGGGSELKIKVNKIDVRGS